MYITFFPDILNHDSLFAGDVLNKIFEELGDKFSKIHIFSDCGPHFRSKEFLYRIKDLSKRKNILISINFFSEYHGKSIVYGLFGRMSKLFQNIDMKYQINSVEEFKNIFEYEAKQNNWIHVHFRVYQRNNRGGKIKKIDMKRMKLYLSYYFNNGIGYYYYLTNFNQYFQMDAKETEEVDKRETKLAPSRSNNLRIKKYYNEGTKKILNIRIS